MSIFSHWSVSDQSITQSINEIVTGRNHGILSIYINIITVSTGYRSECGLQKVISSVLYWGGLF